MSYIPNLEDIHSAFMIAHTSSHFQCYSLPTWTQPTLSSSMQDGRTLRHKKCYRTPLPPDRSSAAPTHCHGGYEPVSLNAGHILSTARARTPSSLLTSILNHSTHFLYVPVNIMSNHWPHLGRVCHYICMKCRNCQN